MPLQLSVERSLAPSGEPIVRLGHELLDDYLTFLAGRARPNSVLAAAFDLKVFFCIFPATRGSAKHLICPTLGGLHQEMSNGCDVATSPDAAVTVMGSVTASAL